jgi:hypothetical protein
MELDEIKHCINVGFRATSLGNSTSADGPRPAIPVERGTMAFGQSGVSGLDDVA